MGREFHWRSDNSDFHIRLEETKDQGVISFGERRVAYRVAELDSQGGVVEVEGSRHRFFVIRDHTHYTVWLGGKTYQLEQVEKDRTSEKTSGASDSEVRASMPGKILRIDVSVGDHVSEKQTVGIMESMKMESTLHAFRSGKVADILCRPGQTVDAGELLMVIE